ncbi:branched-chain amino acid ABC transporter substrate-binding protein [Klebsiella michiganensis]|uniref:branched-chain amino acid ABC transporter substrate-binding protein n=1 Tax=Klebsiella michiganensis TaxID=1134687 RepID=UPI00374B60C1|nr:branched-chain amino acid ABC transporter substrate-binding protein [Klebsiella michiganensis]HCE9049067.1 branched-chain amino acid ABC transporter substrate-binding protein [Klebsiella michiganensis]
MNKHIMVLNVFRSSLIALSLLGSTSLLAKETVKIAFIGPLTGGASATGLGGRNSAQLAVNQHNADPAAKYTFELIKFDDECKPATGVQVVTKAATNSSIIAAIGHYCSAVAAVTVNTYHRFGLPLVVWGAVLPEITYGNNYKEIHRVNGTMINEGKLAAEYVKNSGFKRIAVIYDTTDYGKGQSKYFLQYLKENPQASVVSSFGVDISQQDFSAELTAVQKSNPDILYFGGLTPQGVALRAQMQRMGLSKPMMGVSGILNSGFIDGVGKEAAEGVVSFHNGAPIDKYSQGAAFLKAYNMAGFKEEPDAYGPFAYSAATLIMDAVEKVGPDRKKVRDVLNHTAGYKSLVGTINFDDHRQNLTNAYQYVVQDGKWVYWPDSKYGHAIGK